MRVVVTGGAGFIGANLCRRLLASEIVTDVVALDDLSTGFRENLADLPVRLVEGSILDDSALDEAFTDAQAVVHLAALGSVPRSVANPMATHAANATGTLMVLEAARRHGRTEPGGDGQHGGLHVILSGSSSVYGSNPTLPKHEELATRPLSPYGGSKLAAEGYVLAYGATYGLPVLPFRFFNVFGPLQPAGHAYAAVIPSFVDAALRGEPVTIHGDGTQSRDFTSVMSVTSVLVDAVERRVTSDTPVNLAFGTRITLLDALAELEGLLGRPVERTHVDTRAGDVPHSQSDTTRLRELFPDVRPVPFAAGLRATVEWMRTVHAAT